MCTSGYPLYLYISKAFNIAYSILVAIDKTLSVIPPSTPTIYNTPAVIHYTDVLQLLKLSSSIAVLPN